ncbi:MAG: PIN domain-containing protein [Gammaproteobacteria bacterium]|nr:PIN domain-containing protein [Gammaproteobacteria bacterium]MBU1415001.1 PIN domain-containing protein [Gammaproteobacteria bacterium]
MKNRAHDLTAYAFSKGDALLLDTNVWLYLFPAPSNKQPAFAASYSGAFKKMLAAGAHLAMDALVLSEYLNRYCRIEWTALHKAAHPDFKRFRQSADYAPVGQGAALYAKNILKQCARHDHPFASINVAQVVADFESGSNDFNDGLLAETCRINGWKLVTNDGDFTQGGIEVLTTNRKLIASCT